MQVIFASLVLLSMVPGHTINDQRGAKSCINSAPGVDRKWMRASVELLFNKPIQFSGDYFEDADSVANDKALANLFGLQQVTGTHVTRPWREVIKWITEQEVTGATPKSVEVKQRLVLARVAIVALPRELLRERTMAQEVIFILEAMLNPRSSVTKFKTLSLRIRPRSISISQACMVHAILLLKRSGDHRQAESLYQRSARRFAHIKYNQFWDIYWSRSPVAMIDIGKNGRDTLVHRYFQATKWWRW